MVLYTVAPKEFGHLSHTLNRIKNYCPNNGCLMLNVNLKVYGDFLVAKLYVYIHSAGNIH